MERHGVLEIKDIKSPLMHDYNRDVRNFEMQTDIKIHEFII